MNPGQHAVSENDATYSSLLPIAWQPLTPRGVAAFARTSSCRVFLVQLLFASLAAASVIWFLHDNWFPAVREGIRALPQRGQIRRAQLDWYEASPKLLASSRFLSLTVDLDHSSNEGREAHLNVELGRNGWRLNSLLGYVGFVYPQKNVIAVNRPELEPWWGAWQPMLFAAAGISVIISLFVSWMLLGILYSPVAKLVSFFANRRLGWAESWRICSAALMPGALFMILAIVAYGLGWVDLIRSGFALAFHVLIGWVYVLVSPFFLPLEPQAELQGKNPFSGG